MQLSWFGEYCRRVIPSNLAAQLNTEKIGASDCTSICLAFLMVDVLHSLESCLGTDEAIQFAGYMDPAKRAHIMMEK